MKFCFTLAAFILFRITTGYCQTTYTSLANGNWNNTGSVWSTNGSSACGCSPGYVLLNDTVIINHDINLGNDLEVDVNAHLMINSTGSLSGNHAIESINDGSIVAFGPMDCDEIEIGPGCIGNFYHTVDCVDKFRVEGIVQVDSTVVVSTGDIEVKETGELTFVVPFIEVSVPNGEFKNDGIVNFNNTCLYILQGNFRNKETGFLNGTGYVEVQDGDIRHDPLGYWSPGVNWCCNGEEKDMPFAENCDGCLSILPIDLVSFWGTPADKKVILHWITASEINTDLYIVERSLNAFDWKEIGKVPGISNTLNNTSYSFHDQELPAEKILYYRVGNKNLEGVIDYSPVIAINNPVVVQVSHGYYNIYGSFYQSLDDAPNGIYIEIMDSGNRVVLHHQ